MNKKRSDNFESRAEQSRAEQVKLCPFVLFKKDIKTLLSHG